MDIVQEYRSGKSLHEISRATGVNVSAVRRIVVDAGAIRSIKEALSLSSLSGKLGSGNRGKKRKMSQQTKDRISAAHKGKGKGTSVKPNGYIEYTAGPNKFRGVHIVAVEKIIGRRLFANEVVHHKDGNRQNNDPQNLQLMTRSEHASLHAKENTETRNRDSKGRYVK